MYATKRRRRTIKSNKQPCKDPPKSNPSKRHRERLNSELDHLASLLPFEQNVISKLDKLSILRLGVSYLRTKSYFQAILSERYGPESSLVGRSHLLHDPTFSEGDSIMQALYGFLFVVSHDGEVFFASRTVEQYLGFHQSDIIHQSVMELIHSEDREEFRKQLTWNSGLPSEKADLSFHNVLLPENQCYLYRSFTVRFRCLLDNTSGFITLEINGWLRILHGQKVSSDKPQFGLFATCCPFGPMSLLDLPSRDLTFRSKHKMDLSPVSMDARGQMLFGFSDRELSTKSGYDLIHPEDLVYFASAHEELIKTGSSGLIAYRWITKDLQWLWLQTSCRVIYKNSKPNFVIATHRQLTRDEGEDLLVKRGNEFKLPYPLLDMDVCSNFGFSDDDLSIKPKSPKSKKSKTVNRICGQATVSTRKKRCPYKDGDLTDSCELYNNTLPYNASGYQLEPDLYRNPYSVLTGASMYPTPEVYKIDSDRHSYSNGYYLDHRQYPHQFSYTPNGYQDIVVQATKYGYDYPRYAIDSYAVDIKKRPTPADTDYFTHFDNMRRCKYEYPYSGASRVNNAFDSVSLYPCHNYSDGYVPLIDNHDLLRGTNRNLHSVTIEPYCYPSLEDAVQKSNNNRTSPSSFNLSRVADNGRLLYHTSIVSDLPAIPRNSFAEEDGNKSMTPSCLTQRGPLLNVSTSSSDKAHFCSNDATNDNKGSNPFSSGVAISVIQPTDKLFNRSILCDNSNMTSDLKNTWLPSHPTPEFGAVKSWAEDLALPQKYHSSTPLETYLNNPSKFHLGYNVLQ